MILSIALVIAVVAGVRGTWSPCGLSMLSTLNPVAERARGNRFWLTAAWYLLGALAGGAVLGLGAAVLAFGWGRTDAADTVTWAVVLAGGLVALASDARLFGWSLPEHPRQVDERWLGRYRRWIYAAGYGVQIGTGFATYIMTAGVYLTALLAVLTGAPWSAFVVCLVFGGVRGLSILVAAFARSPGQLRATHARLAGWARSSLLMCLVASAAVAVVGGGQLGGVGAIAGVTVAVVLALTWRVAGGGTAVDRGHVGRLRIARISAGAVETGELGRELSRVDSGFNL